jgi:hypothetical protein
MRRHDLAAAVAWARGAAGRVPRVWEYEHSAEAAATPAAIWRAWSEVDRWGERNADIEAIEIEGRGADEPEFGLGPAITADSPQTVAALLARAEAS